MSEYSKKPLVILTGPTAVGKTRLSLDLAKAIDGEIISADSMQVYKKMNIGTAKIMPEEMEGVPHHLIDVCMPEEECNIAKWQQLTKEAMEQIYSRGHIPILVGGTGFYIQSVLYDIDFSQSEGESPYRKELEAIVKEQGKEFLHEMLAKVDEISAQKIHANNVKRVIRALEYYRETGQPISKHNEEQSAKESPYQFAYFVLQRPREELYRRIDLRVDQMLEQGLVDEVKKLLDEGYSPELVSMQGLGYKEIIPYIQGKCSLEDAVYILKRDTRHFAKRQNTWFRREKKVTWVDLEQLPTVQEQLDIILKELRENEHIIR